MTYTIKQIADLASVSTRTIRYYDEIGLLSPAKIGMNGYRYYDQDSLLILQQILFYRELDIPLEEIENILNRPDFNLVQGLKSHRKALLQKANRMKRLIKTLDQTIAALEKGVEMKDNEIFDGFNEADYEDEVKERWGNTKMYEQSTKRWSSFSKAQKDAIKAEGGEIAMRMVTENPDTQIDDPEVQQAIADYLDYLNKYFYSCDVEFLRILSDMWVQDPRFAVNYERIRSGGAEFIQRAVHYFCDHQNTA